MLHGRDAERAALSQLLDGVRASRSGVLVLRGEAGIGKSALLADAVAQAEDLRVLRASGVESESQLAYAGLHQVLWPLLDRIGELAAPQAAALEAALGLAVSGTPDRFLVSAAALSLLATAAEEQPVLAVVDDAHWLDEPSADALTFAARRLGAEPVGLLFAARAGDERSFAAPGLPELALGSLAPADATALLAERLGTALAEPVRDRVVESAGGNPLALVEIPRALSDGQRAGRDPLGEELPLTAELEQVFLRRAEGTSSDARRFLLLAAADDTGDAGIVLAAADALALAAGSAAEAERTGLVSLAASDVAFRHPLARSALYASASFEERRDAHLALARALDGEGYRDRRAWHRAAATAGLDDEVADELEAAAMRSSRRSGYAATAAALERAAALTAHEETRARRLHAAAEAAWLSGRPARAVSLLEGARRLTTSPHVRADVDHLRALVELQHGVPARAHDLLMAAETEIAPVDPRRAAALLVSAGEAAAFAGDTVGEIEAGRRAAELRATIPELFELAMMAGIAALLSGDAAAGGPLLRDAVASAERSDNPRRLFWAGSCSLYLLDETAGRRFFARAVEETRAAGAVSMLAFALTMLSWAELLEGRVAQAAAAAAEAGPLAHETGQENAESFALAVAAWTHGVRGREDECHAAAEAVLEVVRARELALQGGLATWALAELELGLGRPAEALPHLERLAAPELGARHAAFAMLSLPSYLEAASRAGTTVTADVDAFEGWIGGVESRSRAALVERCRALAAADDEEASACFERALELHAATPRPLEAARTRLLYGERLRRARQPRAAREHLRAALDTFEQLGCAGWAERARSELRASGERARKRDPSTVDQLTAQELQIARLVASGATNKEVAAQLFLSPRTIDFHLRNVFSKLGIASRHELAGLVPGDPEPAGPVMEPATSPVRA